MRLWVDPDARKRLKGAVEALLFVSNDPVTTAQLAKVLEIEEDLVEELLAELQEEYSDRGIQLKAVAGGYQMCTRPEYSEVVKRLLHLDTREPLSQAALETLAIIAYRQPITRAEIEAIRGVRSDHVLEKLLETQLIKVAGRKEAPGRPLLYVTTERFLRYFGLRDLSDLPPLPEGPSTPSEKILLEKSLNTSHRG
ncbi:MAG: SMC-Scp complex subunit ScpB [Armatimonadota bacterium]|nr:SMC-Scp complex subunit ScpB [Armatimonadota bacterium]MDR5704127.1 SMC-Scp complex subunit ScpB [Armatimonadota bacterium]MDR7435267.1 SMC-Scp complex subunit ScpB [Armatimonadota bacterium]